MSCQHDYIITFRTPDGQPVIWACSDCKLKFVPFSQMLTEVAEEREACARVCDKRAADYQMGFEEKYEAQACAYDIRARSEEPKRHPGYIVGDHWLQAAYTRICTGETEDEVMTDYGWQRARGDA